jgi:hypothetical protein
MRARSGVEGNARLKRPNVTEKTTLDGLLFTTRDARRATHDGKLARSLI